MQLTDSDFIVVTLENLNEMTSKARQGPFIHNGMIRPSSEHFEIDINDMVAFPWKNVVERLADIGAEDDE